MTSPVNRRADLARKLLGALDVSRAGALGRAEKAPEVSEVLAAPQPVARGDGPAVLVIDDDPTLCDLVVRALAKDHVVYRANEGKSGLHLLQCVPSIDLVVCDVMMPSMDGYDVARAIKADAALRSIPIMFLTARDSVQDRVAGIQAGVRVYLTKPFKINDLRAAVSRACRRKTTA